MLLPDLGCIGPLDSVWNSSYLRDKASGHRGRSERSDICLDCLCRGCSSVEV